MTTTVRWLERHGDGVPSALAARLQQLGEAGAKAGGEAGEIPGGAASETSRSVAAELVDAGAHALGDVLATPPMTRAHALDVLAADALLTYAFEAAADDPDTLAQRADAAMKSIAALAGED